MRGRAGRDREGAIADKAVLVAVTGMSPAVLTETVWGLAFPAERGTPRVVPDRVIALTTSAGREAIAGQLFGPDAVWDSLREAVLGRGHKTDPRLCFGVTGDAVKVFTIRAGGKPSELSDISTEAENIAVADFITDELWGHVEKPGTRLIASISGGFKTMSALLFAGMSLLGRKDDLITHVLVGAPYDTGALSPRFFFPAQPCQELKGRDGGVWLARDAQLRLGFVPFVPLHDLLEKYRKPRSYSDLVARCKSRLDRQRREPVRLRLSVAKRQVRVNDTVFTLPAQAFLFLWFLAERARSAQAPLGKYLEALRPFQDFARDVQRRWTQLGVGWAAEGKRILPTDFDEAVAKSDDAPVRTRLLYGITERLRRVPGAAPLAAYLPQSGRCTLDLAPKSITIEVPDVP